MKLEKSIHTTKNVAEYGKFPHSSFFDFQLLLECCIWASLWNLIFDLLTSFASADGNPATSRMLRSLQSGIEGGGNKRRGLEKRLGVSKRGVVIRMSWYEFFEKINTRGTSIPDWRVSNTFFMEPTCRRPNKKIKELLQLKAESLRNFLTSNIVMIAKN